MTTHTLEIKTATIEIHVIRVDGHKMTKATFRQIQTDDNSEINEDDILGWVDDDVHYLVWNMNGSIKKRSQASLSYRGQYKKLPLRKLDGVEFTMGDIKANFPQLFIAT